MVRIRIRVRVRRLRIGVRAVPLLDMAARRPMLKAWNCLRFVWGRGRPRADLGQC